MNKSRSRKKSIQPVQISISFFTLLTILLVQGCTPSYSEKPSNDEVAYTTDPVATRTYTPEATRATTATITYTSPPETKQDTIYFWWIYGEKSELWRLEPDGSSSVLYTVNFEYTLEEALKNGFLSVERVETITASMSINLGSAIENYNNLTVQIFPVSLSLSPDKKRLAWEEILMFCPPIEYDRDFCIGESAIRVFDLKKNKLQITPDTKAFTAIIYKPLWSQDNQHIAFLGEDGIIKVLDIKTLSIETVGEGREFRWFPDGHRLAFDSFNGVQVYDLRTKRSAQIAVNSGDILHLAISPNGETLAYTYFNPGTSDLMYAVNLETGENKPIIKWNDRLWLYNVQWLSNNRILYTQEKSYPDPYYIYVRDVETGDIVLSTKIPLEIKPNNSGQLSDDGTKILFIGFRYSGTLSIMVFDFVIENWSFIPLPEKIQEDITSSKINRSWNYNFLQNATW